MTSPLVGGLLGAGVGVGLLVMFAAWHGQLDRPARPAKPARFDRLTVRVLLTGVAAGVAWWLTGWVALAAAAAFAGWLAPTLVGLRARRRRAVARTEAVAVWAEMLRDLLTSSAGLHEAIGKTVRVAPEPIAVEVNALYLRAQRGELAGALRRFAAELADPVADIVVAALLISERRAASDLGALLAAVATSTRETVAMQLRIAAARARIYRTSQLIAGIVGFFIGILVLTNRGYMAPFGTLTGQLVLCGIAAMVVGSLWAMLALSRPAQTPRLLDVETTAVGVGR